MKEESSFQAFKPPWWLPEGHSQTLWRKYRRPESVEQRCQVIELPDNDFINVDWAGPDPEKTTDEQPIVLILHGLCGCSRSSYVLSLQARLRDLSIPSVAMNFRGCGGEINRLARAYHSGVSDDVEWVYSQLTGQYPSKQFAAVGYSLGANVLLKWLGEQSSSTNINNMNNSKIKSAVAVSTPFSLATCSNSMSKGLPAMYGRFFLGHLMADLQSKKKSFAEQNLSDELEKLNVLRGLEYIKTLWEFDDKVTGPLHGFADAEEYYNTCSSINFINGIKIPTKLVQAADDPIIPPSTFPDEKTLPDNVQLNVYKHGGHVGFIEQRKNWLEDLIVKSLIS